MSCWNKDEFPWLAREVTHCPQCKAVYFVTEDEGVIRRCSKCDIDTMAGYMSDYSGQMRLHMTRKQFKERKG